MNANAPRFVGKGFLIAAGLLGVVSACASNESGGGAAPALDGGSLFDGGGEGPGTGPSPMGDLDGGNSTVTDGGPSGANDAAAPGPKDPFRAQSKAAKDQPAASDYVIDVAGDTTVDKTTGLVWSRHALPEGDGYPTTQVAARAQCAAATIGGTTGWRLPTRVELLSILTTDENHTHEPTAFDKTEIDNLPMWVATDDTSRNAFYEGKYHIHTYRKNLVGSWAFAIVHCVKSTYPITSNAEAPEAGRYAVAGSVVSDTVTKLEWSTTVDFTYKTWSQAEALCGALQPAGPNPWRLPTLKEAATLWDESSRGVPAALGFASSTYYFWTSSPFTPPPSLVIPAGYFRFHVDKQLASGDFWWETGDFAPTVCVRNAP